MNMNLPMTVGRISPEGRRRIAMIVVMVCSMVLLWWSLTVRVSLIGEAHSKIHSVFSVDREIDSLRTTWSDSEAATVEKQFQAAKGRLLNGHDHLARWLITLAEEASTIGFDTEYKVESGVASAPGLQGVEIVPIRLMFQARNPHRAYERYLGVLRRLVEDNLLVSLEEVTLSGAGQGVRSMNLLLHVYIRREV